MEPAGDGELMLTRLLDASHLAGLDDLPDLLVTHGRLVGFTDPLIYLADLRQELLVHLPAPSAPPLPAERARLQVDASMAGRAFRNIELVPAHGGRLWIPLLDGTQRVGVLGVLAPQVQPVTIARLRALASLVALLVVGKQQQSDTYARLMRSQPMSRSAEFIWPLMPPLAFAREDIVICGVLEPAYDIAGDAVDYAIAGSLAHLSIFDAMGHDQAAGLTVALATGACRNSRRQGAGLVERSRAIDAAIAEQFARRRFATGIMADLDCATGMLTWVNCGHPPPLLIRGGRWLTSLHCGPAPPMGFDLGIAPTPCQQQLQPGDRLLFYTDGIVEARDAGGEQFGSERFADFVVKREADGLSPPETLRRLIRTILEHQRGRLQDDATVLLVQWRSPEVARMVL
jgi:serine phosphatase RsbU (regulator of sigma subunit)